MYAVSKILQFRLHNGFAAPALQNKGRFESVFTPGLESQLREHAAMLQKMFFRATGMDMRKLAFDFSDANHLQHPFSHKNKMSGPDRMVSFIKSKSKRPNAIRHFEISKSIRDTHKIVEQKVSNIDVPGVSTVQTSKKIAAQRKIEQLGRTASAEEEKKITVAGSVSTAGTFIPSMIIYPKVKTNWNYLFDLFLEQPQQQILLTGQIQIFLCS
jgi:hypothetical protein